MWIGAFYALLLNGRLWIPAIIDSFELIGEKASGVGGLSPSGVFTQGLNIAGSLMDSGSTSAFFTNPGTSLALVVAAALTVISFIAVTIQFVVAMVESYIVVAAGFVFLGFGGSRWTAPYVERYIALGVATGVKIMLLYLLIGTGMNLAVEWQTMAAGVGTSPTPAMSAFEVMGAALIFMMLCWQIPKLFAAVLGGSPALTGGDLVSTVTTLGSAAMMVGATAVAGASIAAGGARAAGAGGAAGGSGGSAGAAGILGMGGGGPKQPPPPSGAAAKNGVAEHGASKQPAPPSFAFGSMAGPDGGEAAVSGNGAGSVPGPNSTTQRTARSMGGEPIAGSGFEGERPAAGFITETEAPSASGATRGGASPAGDPAAIPAPGRTGRLLNNAAGRLRSGRQRVRSVIPSDAAPHATPPRLNFDHHE